MNVCSAPIGPSWSSLTAPTMPSMVMLKQRQHRRFVMGSGESLRIVHGSLRDGLPTLFGSAQIVQSTSFSWTGAIARNAVATEQYAELKNLICWNKGSGGKGSSTARSIELVLFYNGKARHIDDFGLGDKGGIARSSRTTPG